MSDNLKLPVVAQSSLNIKSLAFPPSTQRYMNAGELEVLTALVASVAPKVICEFGVNEGRTAKVLLDNVWGIDAYHGWDVTPGYAFDCKVQTREVPKQPGHLAASDHRFTLHLSARGTFDAVAPAEPYADVVFIDGDHGRAAVMHDTALAYAMVRPGGIVIWHDYHDLGTVDVRDVLDEMFEAGAPIQRVDGTWLAFERR